MKNNLPVLTFFTPVAITGLILLFVGLHASTAQVQRVKTNTTTAPTLEKTLAAPAEQAKPSGEGQSRFLEVPSAGVDADKKRLRDISRERVHTRDRIEVLDHMLSEYRGLSYIEPRVIRTVVREKQALRVRLSELDLEERRIRKRLYPR